MKKEILHNSQMRPIQEIIDELKNHPDYLNSEIFTWTDYLEEINEELLDYELDPIEFSELSEEMKQNIIDHFLEGISLRYSMDFNFFLSLTRNEHDNSIEVSKY